jgi:hypothetical protein
MIKTKLHIFHYILKLNLRLFKTEKNYYDLTKFLFFLLNSTIRYIPMPIIPQPRIDNNTITPTKLTGCSGDPSSYLSADDTFKSLSSGNFTFTTQITN